MLVSRRLSDPSERALPLIEQGTRGPRGGVVHSAIADVTSASPCPVPLVLGAIALPAGFEPAQRHPQFMPVRGAPEESRPGSFALEYLDDCRFFHSH
jgi:hypothetical protein